MTSVSPAGELAATLLGDEDRPPLVDFLERDRFDTVYLRSIVHEHGLRRTEALGSGLFYGGRRAGLLSAVVFVGNARNMTSWGDPADVEALMRRASEGPLIPRLYVGPEPHAPMVRRSFFRDGFHPRLDRRQAYYVLRRATLTDLEPLVLRPAEPRDLDEVARAHAAMIEEDLQIPRPHLDLDRLRDLAAERVSQGKIWVHMDGSALVFKTEEIARAEDALLVGGVYTHPRHRGRGIASRGMAAWARLVLDQGLGALALHVNAVNSPAVRAYERAGFLRTSLLRLILTY